MLDERRLMDLYAESNGENADVFFPEEKDRTAALRRAEDGFLDFLKNEFLSIPGNTVWVLEENGVWVSSLRTSLVRDGVYYLEALETRPDSRRKGCAARLLNGVISALKETGGFVLCDCVGKRNEASLLTHEKCGFRKVSEEGYDYLLGETNERTYGMEYRYIPGADGR